MSAWSLAREQPRAEPVDFVLSCAQEDGALAERLRLALAERGLRVALAQTEGGKAGDRTLGLLVTPQSIESGWAAEAGRRARAWAQSGAGCALVLRFDGAEMPDGLPSVDFADPASFERDVDRVIWPGLTGRQVVFVGVHSGYRAPWPGFRRELDRIGPRFVQGENLNRVRRHLRQIASAGTHRVVVVTDVFEDWPSYRWPRRDSARRYADLLFDLTERTRGTPDALAVLLHHHSRALEEADHDLDAARQQRLRRCCTLLRDLDDDALPGELRVVWNRLQVELLAAARGAEADP